MNKKRPPDCECDHCNAACVYKPGWFLPGEAEKTAELLGISLEELFETRLAVDYWVSDPNIYVLAPSMASEEPGAIYPADPRGRCTFYTDGRCEIHDAKPFECEMLYHDEWEGKETRHEDVAMEWKSHQQQIEELLGEKPEAEFSFHDAFSLIFSSW